VTTPSLNVVIQSDNEALQQKLLRAAFELFVRVGIPFSLHRSWQSVDSDATVIYHGPPELTRKRAIQNRCVVTLPVSTCGLEDCQLLWGADGSALWGGGVEAGVDLLAGAAALLTFSHEERVSIEERDQLGRIPAKSHPFGRLEVLEEPLLENAAIQMRQVCAKHGINVQNVLKPWPNKVPVIITHDVDGPYLHSFFALARSAWYALFRKDKKERDALEFGLISLMSKGDDPYFGFSDWRRFERQVGAVSTFFVYPKGAAGVDVSPRDPRYKITNAKLREEFGRALNEGWSVGLHSGIRAQNSQDYLSSAQHLGRVLGTEVKFVREHYWSIHWKDPYKTWQEMSRAGLVADTSLNPLAVGLRNGTCLPITASTAWSQFADCSFLAIPTAVMDQYEVEAEPRCEKWAISSSLRRLLDHIARVNGCVVLDWHERTMSNTGPWKGYFSRMLNLTRYLSACGQYEFMSLSEVYRLWTSFVHAVFLGVRP